MILDEKKKDPSQNNLNGICIIVSDDTNVKEIEHLSS